ncbi:RHS repeat domain-containing protein [Pseudomonas fluorescens]|uniref:RHS repeat domain-containing protein n=1 Tax=Pseudomonas fluorescens TaxID=294 RepID=UPI003D043036
MSTNVHWRTPELKANDSRGLSIRRVGYLRKVAGGALETLITRQRHDTLGRLVEQWDPRLFGKAPKPNQATVYRLSGEALRVDSVDAGLRLSLAGLAGEMLQHWDQRGHHWRTTHDNQLRVVAVEENAQPKVETFTYADDSADPGHNRRGQLIEQIDRAGVLSFSGFSLHGQPLSETRTFPDTHRYTSHRHYSALGVVLTQTDAGAHQQHTRYDIAGQLKQVMLQLDTASPRQDILNDAQYNAAGQIIEQHAGNGVISTWGYDPVDGRLQMLKAGKPGEALCQNLEYVHDRTGNVLRIEDHTLTTVFFANQRIDGHREFAYDSLCRLTRASGFETEKPNLQPGLPDLITPIDPGRRFNYTEHYRYDRANNLTTVCHRRDGNTFTRQMRIDEHSNRGVRWEEGDPEPIFDELFDPNGNQLMLQRGQPLNWNARDQLAKVTLLVHSNGLPDDEETCLYSQGVRVCKHHVWHTPSANHFHNVRYLPGLEIRTRDDGQQLHVITLSTGVGSVRCLHWVSGKPAGIEPDQLRYHLGDHLGSTALELDRGGAMISLEFYYPYGGTCWYAALSHVEADQKTLRYSGKAMDASGLYDYGARCYAPWLHRWISADPMGDVDGLNRYAMVSNNPLRYFDDTGGNKEESEIKQQLADYSGITFIAQKNLGVLNDQLSNSFYRKDIVKKLGKNTAANFIKAGVKTAAGSAATLATAPLLGPAALFAGFAASYGAETTMEKTDTSGKFFAPLVPQVTQISHAKILYDGTTKPYALHKKAQNALQTYDLRTLKGLKASIRLAGSALLGLVMELPNAFISSLISAADATELMSGLSPRKIEKLNNELIELDHNFAKDAQTIDEAFQLLGVEAFELDGLSAIISTAKDALTPSIETGNSSIISKSEIQSQISETRVAVQKARELLHQHTVHNKHRAA